MKMKRVEINKRIHVMNDRLIDKDNTYSSVNFYLNAPEGDVNIIIMESEPGKIYRIEVLIGKTGSSMRAMCDALSRMITFALTNKHLQDVLVELSSITSDKVIRSPNGVDVRSVPEAIYIALLRYASMYPKEASNMIDYRPPTFVRADLSRAD